MAFSDKSSRHPPKFGAQLGRRNGLRALVVALLVVAFSFVGQETASAYKLEGTGWDNTRPSGCCATIHVQYSSAFYGNDKAGFDNARSAWNNSAANILLPAASGALTVDDTADRSVGWDGITNYGTAFCGYNIFKSCFTYAHVLVNYYYTQNDPASVVQGIAAHELGHAVGIDHASGCVLMTAYTSTRRSCGVSGPVQDDINGVNSLY